MATHFLQWLCLLLQRSYYPFLHDYTPFSVILRCSVSLCFQTSYHSQSYGLFLRLLSRNFQGSNYPAKHSMVYRSGIFASLLCLESSNSSLSIRCETYTQSKYAFNHYSCLSADRNQWIWINQNPQICMPIDGKPKRGERCPEQGRKSLSIV